MRVPGTAKLSKYKKFISSSRTENCFAKINKKIADDMQRRENKKCNEQSVGSFHPEVMVPHREEDLFELSLQISGIDLFENI